MLVISKVADPNYLVQKCQLYRLRAFSSARLPGFKGCFTLRWLSL